MSEIKKGDVLMHKRYGKGTVLDVLPIKDDVIVTIKFENGAVKKLCAEICGLEKADDGQNMGRNVQCGESGTE